MLLLYHNFRRLIREISESVSGKPEISYVIWVLALDSLFLPIFFILFSPLPRNQGVQPPHRQTCFRPPAPERNQGAGGTSPGESSGRAESQRRGNRTPWTDQTSEGNRPQSQPNPPIQATWIAAQFTATYHARIS